MKKKTTKKNQAHEKEKNEQNKNNTRCNTDKQGNIRKQIKYQQIGHCMIFFK